MSEVRTADYRRGMSTSEAARARPAAPPVYTRLPSKVRDDTVRRPLPGQVVDTAFFILAAVAAGWLAWRLFDDAWHSRTVEQ